MVEDRESYIEELVTEYTRKELNEIASVLDLNPGDYQNKRAIAEAILVTREVEEVQKEEITFTEEAPIEYPTKEEVTKEVEKVSPDTVKGKIKAFEKKTTEFNNFAREMGKNVQMFHQSVRELIKDYENFMKTEFHHGINEFHHGINAFHQSIREMKQIMQDQVLKHQNYVKQFYG
jgi:hypothetical protein